MKRTDFIDYAKAVSILFVVFIHVGFSSLNSIMLFVMPVFFAATGYTYDYDKRSFGDGVKLRFKAIMLPFWYMMLFYTIIEIVRAYLFGYGTVTIALPSLLNTVYGSGIIPVEGGFLNDIKTIMSYKAQPVSGVDMILASNCHLWFLPAMFTGYVIFSLLAKPSMEKPILKVIAIIILLAIAMLETSTGLCQLPYGIGRGTMAAAFMLVGFWIKEYKLINKKSVVYNIITTAAALIIYITALMLGSDGSLFVRSVYGPYGSMSVIITFFGGVGGIYLIYILCTLLERLPIRRFKALLSFTGRNVITIYLWHMAVKFVLDAVYIYFNNSRGIQLLDEYKMGLLPQNSFVYMIFEGVTIIAVCLLAAVLKEKKAGKSLKYDARA